MLTALRDLAPPQLAARVGDMNENLSYEMQDSVDGGIASMILRGGRKGRIYDNNDVMARTAMLSPSILCDIQSFERSVQSKLQRTHISYRGSYMRTLHTAPQPAHVDYDYATLDSHGKRLFLAFFPLTEEGAYLQLWRDPATVSQDQEVEDEEKILISDDEDDGNAYIDYDSRSNSSGSISNSKSERTTLHVANIVEGTVVYIPYGMMLIVPSDTIHGGGFKRGTGGNLRFHLYIAVDDDGGGINDDNAEGKRVGLLQHPMNKYTERYDRRRELSERFVDSYGLDGLIGQFFDD